MAIASLSSGVFSGLCAVCLLQLAHRPVPSYTAYQAILASLPLLDGPLFFFLLLGAKFTLSLGGLCWSVKFCITRENSSQTNTASLIQFRALDSSTLRPQKPAHVPLVSSCWLGLAASLEHRPALSELR